MTSSPVPTPTLDHESESEYEYECDSSPAASPASTGYSFDVRRTVIRQAHRLDEIPPWRRYSDNDEYKRFIILIRTLYPVKPGGTGIAFEADAEQQQFVAGMKFYLDAHDNKTLKLTHSPWHVYNIEKAYSVLREQLARPASWSRPDEYEVMREITSTHKDCTYSNLSATCKTQLLKECMNVCANPPANRGINFLAAKTYLNLAKVDYTIVNFDSVYNSINAALKTADDANQMKKGVLPSFAQKQTPCQNLPFLVQNPNFTIPTLARQTGEVFSSHEFKAVRALIDQGMAISKQLAPKPNPKPVTTTTATTTIQYESTGAAEAAIKDILKSKSHSGPSGPPGPKLDSPQLSAHPSPCKSPSPSGPSSPPGPRSPRRHRSPEEDGAIPPGPIPYHHTLPYLQGVSLHFGTFKVFIQIKSETK